jgi:hypothetical protein
MAGSADKAMDSYLSCIRHTLDAALCIRNFASQEVERHNVPEVETRCVCCPPSFVNKLPAQKVDFSQLVLVAVPLAATYSSSQS